MFIPHLNATDIPQPPHRFPNQPNHINPTQDDAKCDRPSTPTMTDEGYDSERSEECDENDEKSKEKEPANDREIPIVKSTHTIRVSYTPFTYIITFLIIGLHAHALYTRPSEYLFPNLFNLFNLAFHLTHLLAHTFHRASIERLSVAFGTSVFWIGWVLGVFAFGHNVSVDLIHPTTILFWVLMFDRRNAWGIIMWEHITHLEEEDGFDVESSRWQDRENCGGFSSGSGRVIAYRVWCLAGVGSMWGLIYMLIGKFDGVDFIDILSLIPILKIYVLNLAAGVILICWWSFWTFQYRGVVWRKELKEGVVVWYSDGYIRAEVE
ncbi:hypothetical protein BC936DRAFT_142219 [Jimgerdemannia flammicorona]|uniref:Uncharacterized protein n=2 Tax=Jimgerdemannia flammicorona TaxID=994334 RepID=A0A433DFH0_9FUNG|nr:hypothetical protein BC936DRAFT_142219 [Jimgerdemannia flammicorona]RUS32988.1 hypothetical protein BC938DRAFT_473598 [Jimgerdemannia flammicorona]